MNLFIWRLIVPFLSFVDGNITLIVEILDFFYHGKSLQLEYWLHIWLCSSAHYMDIESFHRMEMRIQNLTVLLELL